MKRKLVVANWKMYIESPEEAKKFVSSLRRKNRLFSGVDVVIAPPYTLMSVVAAGVKGSNMRVGAQAISQYDSGAHTGFVSADMIKKIGAQFAIV